MRVAVVAPPWLPVPPPAYGGTETVVDGLCRGLAAAGQDVLLCSAGHSTCPVEQICTSPDAPGTGGMSPQTELRHVICSYDAIRRWQPDVVHDHTLVGPVYGRDTTTMRVVTTLHGPIVGELEPVYRAITAHVPAIAISHDQRARAPQVPVVGVIHHGIDVSRFPLGTGAGGYAAFVGRMTPEKGVTRAIDAARAAGVPLRIAAKMKTPDEHAFFRGHVEPRLGGDVEFVGEVGGEDKARLLGDAVCLLNPIAWPEPFGMVMIEALACGTPVVVTPIGSAPEIVDHGATGFLCEDESATVDALARVEQLDRRECRAVACEWFSIDRMAREHVALFERLLVQ